MLVLQTTTATAIATTKTTAKVIRPLIRQGEWLQAPRVGQPKGQLWCRWEKGGGSLIYYMNILIFNDDIYLLLLSTPFRVIQKSSGGNI